MSIWWEVWSGKTDLILQHNCEMQCITDLQGRFNQASICLWSTVVYPPTMTPFNIAKANPLTTENVKERERKCFLCDNACIAGCIPRMILFLHFFLYRTQEESCIWFTLSLVGFVFLPCQTIWQAVTATSKCFLPAFRGPWRWCLINENPPPPKCQILYSASSDGLNI